MQLESTRTQLVAGDTLIATVGPTTGRPNGSRVEVDTGSGTLLQERAGLALTVWFPDDVQSRIYVFRLAVCAEVQHTLPATASNYLGVPGNPRMAVVPFFHEYAERASLLDRETGYIFGKSTKFGVPDPIPIFSTPPRYPDFVSHVYRDGEMAIVRFDAADWPAAQEAIENMMRDVLSRMIQCIGDAHRRS